MAGKLFLYVSELKGFAAAGLAGIWGIGAKEQKEISTLEDMVKEISQHRDLRRLVIFAHGFPGGLILDDEAYALDEAALAKESARRRPRSKHIRFEGCWVGESPVKMAAFGRIFSANDVSGLQLGHAWTGEATVTIPKGIKAQDLTKFLQNQNLEKWLMPGSPSVPGARLNGAKRRREEDAAAAVVPGHAGPEATLRGQELRARAGDIPTRRAPSDEAHRRRRQGAEQQGSRRSVRIRDRHAMIPRIVEPSDGASERAAP